MSERPSIELIPVSGAPLVGEVVEFDDDRGLGSVKIGERTVPFHCTAITDGSRHVDVGTIVVLTLGAGRLGRVEARWVRPLPGVTSRGASVRSANGASTEPQVGPGPALGPLPPPPPPPPSDDTPPSGTASVPAGGAGPAGSVPPSV